MVVVVVVVAAAAVVAAVVSAAVVAAVVSVSVSVVAAAVVVSASIVPACVRCGISLKFWTLDSFGFPFVARVRPIWLFVDHENVDIVSWPPSARGCTADPAPR